MAESARVLQITTLDGKMVDVSVTSGSTVADVAVAVAKAWQPSCSFQLLSDQAVLKDSRALIPTDVNLLTCAFLSRLSWSLGPFEDALNIDRRAIAMFKNADPETLEMQPTMSSHLLRFHRLAAWHDLGEYTPGTQLGVALLLNQYGLSDDLEQAEVGAHRVFSFTLIDGADSQFRMIAVIYDNGGGLDGVVYLRPQFQVGQMRLIANIKPVDDLKSSWEVLDDTWYRNPVQQMPACDNEQAGGPCADTPLKVHLAHAISCGLWSM
mmetsp:Transcript_74576/g.136278  ORF Transcript_74576/g.136278 Transcript_74576/m.136278 type:complete len:266 (+) Transcript_74576:74-871(+)